MSDDGHRPGGGHEHGLFASIPTNLDDRAAHLRDRPMSWRLVDLPASDFDAITNFDHDLLLHLARHHTPCVSAAIDAAMATTHEG
jgi:hypothetical protein